MANIVEEIRSSRRIARMRLGQESPVMTSAKSAPEVRFAMVPLTEAEHELSLAEAAAIEAPENDYGVEMRDRVLKANHMFHSLRNPDEIKEKIFSGWKEVSEVLEFADLEYLGDEYAAMMHDQSPAYDGMTDEEVADLKKALETIDWSVLSGRPWWHLKMFFMTITPTQLVDNSYGHDSISKLIGMSENKESTQDAE